YTPAPKVWVSMCRWVDVHVGTCVNGHQQLGHVVILDRVPSRHLGGSKELVFFNLPDYLFYVHARQLGVLAQECVERLGVPAGKAVADAGARVVYRHPKRWVTVGAAGMRPLR